MRHPRIDRCPVIVPLDAASNDLSFPGRDNGLGELSFLRQLADGVL
jgi:hypothetical protein